MTNTGRQEKRYLSTRFGKLVGTYYNNRYRDGETRRWSGVARAGVHRGALQWCNVVHNLACRLNRTRPECREAESASLPAGKVPPPRRGAKMADAAGASGSIYGNAGEDEAEDGQGQARPMKVSAPTLVAADPTAADIKRKMLLVSARTANNHLPACIAKNIVTAGSWVAGGAINALVKVNLSSKFNDDDLITTKFLALYSAWLVVLIAAVMATTYYLHLFLGKISERRGEEAAAELERTGSTAKTDSEVRCRAGAYAAISRRRIIMIQLAYAAIPVASMLTPPLQLAEAELLDKEAATKTVAMLCGGWAFQTMLGWSVVLRGASHQRRCTGILLSPWRRSAEC